MEQWEIQDVLRRAQEIEHQQGTILDSADELDAFVEAAEESGISRDAVVQALRERLRVSAEAIEVGQLVFAPSADRRHHVATVVSNNGKTAKIRFVSGGEQICSIADLRMFSLTPGLRVEFNSPSMGVWLTAPVSRYNAEARTVTVNAWGTDETVSLEKVRLAPHRERGKLTTAHLWTTGIVATLLGTGLGVLISQLLFR